MSYVEQLSEMTEEDLRDLERVTVGTCADLRSQMKALHSQLAPTEEFLEALRTARDERELAGLDPKSVTSDPDTFAEVLRILGRDGDRHSPPARDFLFDALLHALPGFADMRLVRRAGHLSLRPTLMLRQDQDPAPVAAALTTLHPLLAHQGVASFDVEPRAGRVPSELRIIGDGTRAELRQTGRVTAGGWSVPALAEWVCANLYAYESTL